MPGNVFSGAIIIYCRFQIKPRQLNVVPSASVFPPCVLSGIFFHVGNRDATNRTVTARCGFLRNYSRVLRWRFEKYRRRFFSLSCMRHCHPNTHAATHSLNSSLNVAYEIVRHRLRIFLIFLPPLSSPSNVRVWMYKTDMDLVSCTFVCFR